MRLLLSLAVCAALALPAPPTLFREPALSSTHIVFRYADDLWIVPRSGGEARRLTTGIGVESGPRFSPDGRTLAFTAEYDGNTDVYLLPSTGGVPKRLTFHPSPDFAVGWTPDSRRVLLRSNRLSYSRFAQLFTMPADGVFPDVVPIHMADAGSYSPDGARLAYTPLAPAFSSWKRYRGGRTSPIWIATLSDSSIERIPRDNSNDFNPLWIDHRIFFLSDRDGAFTLYSYDTRSRRVSRSIPPGPFDIKSASAFAASIVYEQFGSIFLYDVNSSRSTPVSITLSGDLPEVRPRFERVASSINAAAISPTGVRAVFEARGDIFTAPAEKGDIRNLTASSSAADRDPAWSPDGRYIAWLSDSSGEYELLVAEHTGRGEARRFRLSDPPSFYYDPRWSPDSSKIAFTTKKLQLAWLDLATSKVTIADTDRFDGPRRIRHFAWSPDSRWLAYTKQLSNTLRAVFVYSLSTGQTRQVTDGMSDATLPVFDRDGRYLYFTASTDYGLNLGWRDMSSYFRPTTQAVYLAVLRKDLPSPLAPESDEEQPAAAAPKTDPPKSPKTPEVSIDFDSIEQRIIALPIPARDYSLLAPAKPGILLLLEQPFRTTLAPGEQPGAVLHKFDLKTRKTDRVADGIRNFSLSANAEKMLLRQRQQWIIAPAGQAPKPNEGILKLDAMEARIEPLAEWRQMFREAWRIQRDHFYDPNLHGVDIPRQTARFEPFLNAVASRSDLNYLFSEMMGEFTASHLYIGGGQSPEPRRVPGGLLGADFALENSRYRFARVFNGENWNPSLQAPLTQPGVNVVAGEYLLAVNGRDLRSTDNLYSFFEATAGRQVSLRVGPNPDGSGARDVTVVPVASEQNLRNLAWIEDNRRKVDQLSQGRLAYVYLPDTAYGGYTNFNRYYFAQTGRLGAVVDERFNGGGSQPDYIIDYLRRPLLHYRAMREGEDITGPLAGIFGPKAMLINEYAGSGGDTLPWYFRQTKIGPLIGKRTWGGLVGGLGGYPRLIDGGSVSAPSVGFWDAQTGQWVAENVGIAPDIEVEMDPKAVREGRDPQLEKAVEVLLAELAKNPPPRRTRPAYPNYHQPRR